MKLSKFKFNLPQELIALHPAKNRDESRLMIVNRKTGEIEHKVFKDLLSYFGEKDVFIFNNTKVFPARLYGNKEKTVFGMYWSILPVKSVSVINCILVKMIRWWLK